MTDVTGPVGPAEIAAAAELLEGVAITTPMEESRWLSALVGGPVLLKCENLQRTGSFKIRGAYVRMSRLSADERARGVVAASAGNHAQGVALAAQMLGIKATVFMPEGAPIPKLNATRGYGAEVVFHGAILDEALARAIEYAEETGAVLIHPFDHADIVAGQATCGLEILAQAPEAATVLVPTGGGGLVAGVALAIKAHRPDVRLVGVQAEGAAAYPGSLAAGEPVALASMTTMADGIAVARPGQVPFAAIERLVDEVVTVSEESISRALVLLLERAKLVVEPAGAVAVAAILDQPEKYATPAVAVLSGGNVDPLLLSKLIRHGLASAGRYLNIAVRIPDRPGGLARLLGELADCGANVLEVVHERTSGSLSIDEVEVHVQLETRGPEHTEAVLTRLREHGYRVTASES
ncbi:threonine ammonia-lyase [Nocardioides marmorisolisilvae]|uniref:L-threonine dehydratase catabolic TdcB n=1 Tax=Nocardioides marmorisolisilvae TaxID=1542737 RepID=A0A3N0DZ62_9ACTN|nr:threonine ammonia-lyase [Nocardioides marmorisolisilvae]RNL80892.1 threonine ammonia-lyase [Nocardioides marmorisolisilvae]